MQNAISKHECKWLHDLVGQKGDPGPPGNDGMKLLNNSIRICMSQMNNNHIAKYWYI